MVSALLVNAVQIGCALAWLGVAIHVWTRTNSVGAMLLVLHGLVAAGSQLLWRFGLPLLSRCVGMRELASFVQALGMLPTLLLHALLIGGVLLLVRDLKARPAPSPT
jgi:hypothetical protein